MTTLKVIVGPTASGKTELGISLAKQGGAVVSADSRQIYVGMDIGTAKPLRSNRKTNQGLRHDVLTPDVVSGVEHYLFNIREPDQQLTLAEWQEAAFNVIERLVKNGISPLLVGGTMLYVDSVVFNYDIPPVASNTKWRRKLESLDVADLFVRLQKEDPAAARLIQPENKRRIVRALEVIKVTGRPFSQLRKKRPAKYKVEMMGIFPGWDELRARITKRTRQMLTDGLLEEVQVLRNQYGASLPLLQTINYKQAGAVLDGEKTKDEAREEMIRVNMRYARRQMSWWRNRPEIKWGESATDFLL